MRGEGEWGGGPFVWGAGCRMARASMTAEGLSHSAMMASGPGRNKLGELGGDRIFTGMCPQMWEGATVPFPPEALRATDSDSGPEDLVYTIERPSNGQVVLRAAPGTEVHSFTQAQLDGGLVLFSHRGEY